MHVQKDLFVFYRVSKKREKECDQGEDGLLSDIKKTQEIYSSKRFGGKYEEASFKTIDRSDAAGDDTHRLQPKNA